MSTTTTTTTTDVHKKAAAAVEWESTITIRIDKSVFDEVAAAAAPANNAGGVASDIIFIFANGTRLSARTVQRKIVTDKKHVLGYAKSRFYPIRRTRATEETTDIDPTLSIEKAVHRLIVRGGDDNAEDDDDDDDDGGGGCKLRLAYNKEEVEDGVRYTLTCEAEYPHTSTYDQIVKYEQRLMRKMSPHFVRVTPDKLTLGELFSCVVPKVQMWNCFDSRNRFLWAYKWNGVKAKFMRVNDHVYIWPDAGEIYTEPYEGDLEFTERMCLQVELMDDRIVIVEVIAAAYYEEIYSVEPLTNVEILHRLNSLLTVSPVTVGDKCLTVQTFYDTDLPKSYDRAVHDGFIIVQQDLTIKWKPPTVDVKCIGPHEYVVGSDDQTTVIRLPVSPRDEDHQDEDETEGVTGCIYEMCSNFKILRRRVDRITCSTTKEYRAFLESVKLIPSS